MTSPFHQHLDEQLQAALRTGVAVVVDPVGAFVPYVDDLTTTCSWSDEHPDVALVKVGDVPARFVRFAGSWFGVRAAVEPFVSGDAAPSPGVFIYVPAPAPDETEDVLMELARAGRRLTWTFETEARNCLRAKFTDGMIDEVLEGGRAGFEDVVAFLAQRGGGKASRLKVVFKGESDANILVRWLASDAHDEAIGEKGAQGELVRLVQSRAGLDLDEAVALPVARARLARFVLLNEFRHDLRGDPPGAISSQPTPGTDAQVGNTLDLARRFRVEFPAAYVSRARQIEQEFHLAKAKVKPEELGRIDTFEFEERLLLTWCASLLEARQYEAAHAVVVERENSFWVEWTDASSQMPRKEQWEICRRVANLGQECARVRWSMKRKDRDAREFVYAYTSSLPEMLAIGELPSWRVPSSEERSAQEHHLKEKQRGTAGAPPRFMVEQGQWYRLDAAQRALETWRGRVLDDTLVEKAVGVVLREHERLLHDMALGFSKVLAASGWTVPGVLHQTRIHPGVITTLAGGTVAWFFVDAMRFEMGAELAKHLDGVADLHLQPAIAALPSITPVGMAALLPGASANFSVVQHKGKLAALVDNVPLPGVAERIKYLKSRVPDVVDLTLSAALQDKPSDLKKKVAGRSLVAVRSTEIDYLGETGDDHLARQSMDTVIGNIARAVRRLAAAGVEHFVITADHGHQFGLRKGDDMKTDAPGGDTVELHRRCWVGRGGATPPGTVRVNAADLGYASDLEFVFPKGLGVFKAGGDLSFHHGSTSLQEIVIPVLSFRIPAAEATPEPGGVELRLKGVPDAITNRMFVVNVEVSVLGMFAPEAVEVRVVLLSEKAEQAGEAGMASGGELDRERGVLRVKPGTTAHVGMMLANDEAASVRVVVLEPATGAVLAQSAALPLKLLR